MAKHFPVFPAIPVLLVLLVSLVLPVIPALLVSPVLSVIPTILVSLVLLVFSVLPVLSVLLTILVFPDIPDVPSIPILLVFPTSLISTVSFPGKQLKSQFSCFSSCPQFQPSGRSGFAPCRSFPKPHNLFQTHLLPGFFTGFIWHIVSGALERFRQAVHMGDFFFSVVGVNIAFSVV